MIVFWGACQRSRTRFFLCRRRRPEGCSGLVPKRKSVFVFSEMLHNLVRLVRIFGLLWGFSDDVQFSFRMLTFCHCLASVTPASHVSGFAGGASAPVSAQLAALGASVLEPIDSLRGIDLLDDTVFHSLSLRLQLQTHPA